MHFRVSLCVFVTALFGAACAGGGQNGASPAIPKASAQNTATLVTTNLKTPISGVVNVASLTVEPLKTLTVSAPAFVHSVGPITINGTVHLDPGASVVFVTPSFSLYGKISASNGGIGVVAPSIYLDGASSIVYEPPTAANDTSGVDGSISFVSPDGTIAINSGSIIQAHNGDNATAFAPPDTPGGAQRGGDIEIGTAKAATKIDLMAFAAGKTDYKASATAPKSVALNYWLISGRGGKGYSDQDGTLSMTGTTVTLNGGDGADSGNVDIAAGTVTFQPSAALATEDAGAGGWTGVHDKLHFDVAMDGGVAPGSPGKNLIARTGNGGNSGSITVTTASPPANSFYTIGRGGLAGDFEYARAGDGGPGGNGGDVTITLGTEGRRGSSPGPPAGGAVHAGDAILHGGSNGGRSNDATMPGGNGGHVTVIAAASPNPYFYNLFIALTHAGSAGGGMSNCPGAGTNAGTAGTLTVPAAQTWTATESLNGGNGGWGDTPGKGSQSGQDNFGVNVGHGGQDGAACGIDITFIKQVAKYPAYAKFTIEEPGFTGTFGVGVDEGKSTAPYCGPGAFTFPGPGPDEIDIASAGPGRCYITISDGTKVHTKEIWVGFTS